MKKCELCDSHPKLYCESDQANLCWECDTKVHSANFLVAKHTRTLLCYICQSLTSLKVSGSRSGPGTSICQVCVKRSRFRQEDEDDENENLHVVPCSSSSSKNPAQISRVLMIAEECSSNFSDDNGEEDEKDGLYNDNNKWKLNKAAKLGSQKHDQTMNAHSSNESACTSASSISKSSKDLKKLKSRSNKTVKQTLKHIHW